MIPMIEKELVEKKGWITSDEISDMVAIAEATPGAYRREYGDFRRV